jgi:two-component system Ni(II)/redox-responsive regulator NrsR
MVDFPGVMRILLVEDESDLGLAIKQVLISERSVVDWVTISI